VDTGPGPWPLQDEKWKNHAVKQIKRFAQSKKTVDIQASVGQNFRIGGEFALGRPVSVFGLIPMELNISQNKHHFGYLSF
jgi:hypothetical protein